MVGCSKIPTAMPANINFSYSSRREKEKLLPEYSINSHWTLEGEIFESKPSTNN